MAGNNSQGNIPLHNLRIEDADTHLAYEEEIFSGEIEGLKIFHRGYAAKANYPLNFKKDCAVFLLILKGSGMLNSAKGQQFLEKESLVVIPKDTTSISIALDEGASLHFLEFTKTYSEDDKVSLRSSGIAADQFYAARFQDCEPYTEKIKSPNTISRTVLPSEIIPRVALGTVESKGPDKVGEHSHPMLEQLFLGLEDNDITVYADDDHCKMGAYSLLHIPLGSEHWVEVKEDCKMNYMWMDFFLTKAGEVWLDTHKPIVKDDTDKTTT